ncbi:hypothetical protein RB11766 [Rhodopirellula baltica SH 1]|uniref:Uncharacterized protein n=1 Tax=Rhodopirellula baltica (strain DSM 10527 / NCIMB 13988 / SH1) TaxID=243090 RepID=Q7UDV1_RHOBA|nr:hypothetical protein RB11766 [Rhodopirellula baltica SH 1]
MENKFFQLVRTRFAQKTFCNEAFPMIVVRCEIAQCRNFFPREGGSSDFNRLNACFPQNPQLGSLLTLELVPLPWGARRSLFPCLEGGAGFGRIDLRPLLGGDYLPQLRRRNGWVHQSNRDSTKSPQGDW